MMEKANEIDRNAASPAYTYGQLAATVSTFYDDYRNMPVCWDEAVSFSIASLRGNAAADQELAAARKRGAENGCK